MNIKATLNLFKQTLTKWQNDNASRLAAASA